MKEKFCLGFSMAIDRFYRKKLTIDQSGHCELIVESNIEQPNTPEIGRYLLLISDVEARKLHDRVVRLSDVPLPAQGPFLPGEPLFEVFLEKNGERQTRTFDPHTAPKRYQVIGRELTRIEREVRKNIVAGLRIDFSMNSDAIDREAPIQLSLRFTGVGTEPIRFYNPLCAPVDGFGRITLRGVRSDIKPQELQFFHRQSYDLTKKDLRIGECVIPLDKTVLSLKPGATLSLKFELVLDWPPGQYHMSIAVDSTGPTEGGSDFVVGRVLTPPQPLIITGAPKLEDEGITDYEPPKF